MLKSFIRRDGHIIKLSDQSVVSYCHAHEDWFRHNGWVAEFWCTATMVPLGVVSLWSFFKGELLGGLLSLHATLASAAFHAAPFSALLRWDQLAAGSLMLWCLPRFQWRLLLWYLLPLVAGAADAVSRRVIEKPVHGLHPLWHCLGALSFFVILSSTAAVIE